ncbi:hypothetical protein F4604DRAFT_1928913 [Suillus subluteus]|nr:hypothetical protein F4604DRAFT_1928913 [Suillus subluteus]
MFLIPLASLSPLLATLSVPIIYCLRFPPTSLGFPLSSSYPDCGYELLRVPFTPEQPRQTRLIGPDFIAGECVTCLDVLATLYVALRRQLTDTEWGTAGHSGPGSLIGACDRLVRIQPALRNSTACTTPTARAARAAFSPRRSHVAFVGLVKDEAFARSKLDLGDASSDGRKDREDKRTAQSDRNRL